MANKEYTADLQKLFLEMMIQDAQSFERVQNIYNPENFDRNYRDTATFIQEHADKHKTLPTICLLYTSPSPRDLSTPRMPSSA